MCHIPPSEFDWSCRRFACTSDLSRHVHHPRLCYRRLYGHSIMRTAEPSQGKGAVPTPDEFQRSTSTSTVSHRLKHC